MFIRSELLGPVYTQREGITQEHAYQEEATPGGHHGGCAPEQLHFLTTLGYIALSYRRALKITEFTTFCQTINRVAQP